MPRKKKPQQHTTIVFITVYKSVRSIQRSARDPAGVQLPTATLSSDAQVTSSVSELPPGRTHVGATEDCGDDGSGSGSVRTLSGRQARKLQREAPLINAGLSAAIQTVHRRSLRCCRSLLLEGPLPCRGHATTGAFINDVISSRRNWEQPRASAWMSAPLDRRRATTEGMVFSVSDCRSNPRFDGTVPEKSATFVPSSPTDLRTRQSCKVVATSTGNGLRRVQDRTPSRCEISEPSISVMVQSCI